MRCILGYKIEEKGRKMSSVNLFIKENVQKIATSGYVTPEIPEKKLNNVITTYKCEDYKNCQGNGFHYWHGEKKNVLVCHNERLKKTTNR